MRQVYQCSDCVWIDGKQVKCLRWNVAVGLAGAIGSANIFTTRRALAEQGLYVDQFGPDVPIEIEVATTRDDSANGPALISIFGGILDHAEIQWAADQVHIFAKDYAFVLQEAKDVLASINLENQTPSDIALQIANKFKFTPRVTKSPLGADGKPVYAGQYFNEDATFSPDQAEPWAILQHLAKSIGFDCYVSAKKELFFCPPRSDQKPLELTWLGSKLEAKAKKNSQDLLPILDMRTVDSPRRNATFEVNVQSFNQQTQEVVDASVYVLDQEFVKSEGTTGQTGGGVLTGSVSATYVQRGTYSGPSAEVVAHDVDESAPEELGGYPTFIFQINGLTNQQAHQKAEAYARDIARRRVTKDIIIDGYPEILVQHPIELLEGAPGVLDGYAGKIMDIGTVSHAYNPPPRGDGFTTSLGCVAVPPGATDITTELAANEITKKTATAGELSSR